eukprot:8164155-Pyramimonas_sp.AAC.1
MCLKCGQFGSLLHRHCECVGWPPELKLPKQIAELDVQAADGPTRVFLERCLAPYLQHIVRPARDDRVCWLGDNAQGWLPAGTLYLAGSAYEGEYE